MGSLLDPSLAPPISRWSHLPDASIQRCPSQSSAEYMPTRPLMIGGNPHGVGGGGGEGGEGGSGGGGGLGGEGGGGGNVRL